MSKLGIFVLLWMAAAAISIASVGWQGQTSKTTASASTEIRTNPGARMLDPAVVAQHRRIQSLLRSETKEKIGAAVPEFRQQTRGLKSGADLRSLATAQVRKQFPNLTPRQADVLAFALLNETYASLQASAPANDISTEQQMQLQQLMEQKSQFEAVISNMLKSVSDTSDGIIQNIKS